METKIEDWFVQPKGQQGGWNPCCAWVHSRPLLALGLDKPVFHPLQCKILLILSFSINLISYPCYLINIYEVIKWFSSYKALHFLNNYGYTGKLHFIDQSIKYPFIMLLNRIFKTNKHKRRTGIYLQISNWWLNIKMPLPQCAWGCILLRNQWIMLSI